MSPISKFFETRKLQLIHNFKKLQLVICYTRQSPCTKIACPIKVNLFNCFDKQIIVWCRLIGVWNFYDYLFSFFIFIIILFGFFLFHTFSLNLVDISCQIKIYLKTINYNHPSYKIKYSYVFISMYYCTSVQLTH